MPWRRGDGVCSVGVGIRCDVEDENAACTGGDTLLLLPPPVYAAAVAVVEAHLALGEGPCWESETRGGVAFSGVATKTEWSLRECVQASIGRLSLPPSPPRGVTWQVARLCTSNNGLLPVGTTCVCVLVVTAPPHLQYALRVEYAKVDSANTKQQDCCGETTP